MFLHHWAFSRSEENTMDEEEREASVKEGALGNKHNKPSKGKKDNKLLHGDLTMVYGRDFDKMRLAIPRCYIDCYYFSKLNKQPKT